MKLFVINFQFLVINSFHHQTLNHFSKNTFTFHNYYFVITLVHYTKNENLNYKKNLLLFFFFFCDKLLCHQSMYFFYNDHAF